MTWVLNKGALWDATPLTSRFFHESEEDDQPVEDVRAEVERAVSEIANEEWKRLPVGALVKPASWNATPPVTDDRCHWCNVLMVKITTGGTPPKDGRTREHILPRSYEGGSDPSNLTWACYQCNQKRTTDLTWVAYAVHGGNPSLMSESQRFAFKKMGKVK